MYGVAFVVEEVSLILSEGVGHSRQEVTDWLMARSGSLTGQVMSSCKVSESVSAQVPQSVGVAPTGD